MLLTGFVLAFGLSHGQKPDSVPNLYIKSYSDKFFLWPVLKQRTLSFEIQNPKQIGNSVNFKPNNAYGLGLGMYLFDLGIELVFAVPVEKDKELSRGKTTAQDIQLNIISRKWGGDIFYQRYNGFYLDNPDSPVNGGAYPQRPDVQTQNIGATAFYVFNSEKFSLRSAFTFADRQLKSSGSFLLSTGFNAFRFTADSVVVNNHYATRIGLVNPFTQLDHQTLSFAPGYSYNLVVKKFFLNGTFSLGPAIHWISYEYAADNRVSHTTVNTFADFRLAFGYSTDRFFTGVTFATQTRNARFEDIQFSNSSGTYRLLFGFRFQEVGILKKSVWSLLPGGKSK
ncbi:MAG TPA: DUF4421 family protein [Cyclobacteriaceae bacterium]|nr:DUF4421 family protein [Cyclobacteriaceae bacterium]